MAAGSVRRKSLIPAEILALSLAGLGVALSLAYWPGLVTWDSVRQYDQAISGNFDDWHPPIMEWVWRQFITLYPGPAPMLLFQLSLYGAGFALLIGWALGEKRKALAIALGGCALMPISIELMGEIIKDSLMTGVLLCATGLLALRDRRYGLGIGWAGIILLLFAAMLRFNAFLAALPLCVVHLPRSFHHTPKRLAVAIALSIVALMLAMPLANRLIGAERSGVELSLVIFDLGGITEHSGINAFPQIGVDDPVAVNHRCYSPVKWDSYSWWVDQPCPIDFEKVHAALQSPAQGPYGFWLTQILAHPLAYIEHRLQHWNINARFLVHDEIERPAQIESAPNPWNFRVSPSGALALVDYLVLASAHTPLGWPSFWMALSLGLVWLGQRLPTGQLIVPLALSALLYGAGYAVFSVASELRYYLWTMVAALIATVIALSDLASQPRGGRKWIHFGYALAPAIMVAALGAIWRLMPVS